MSAQGFVAPGFERVREAFNAGLAEEMGAGFAVIRDGEVIVELWGGWANREHTRAWERDTIVPVYSTTKGVSALVLAKLFDDGVLDYEATTASLWPAFGAHGKDKVTIAQTLGAPGRRAGLHRADRSRPVARSACMRGGDCGAAPLWPPGSASGYHPLTWGYIAGEIAQRASGRSLGTILREDVCGPLGIDFQLGTPESDHARASEMRKPTRGGEFGEITPPRKAAFFSKWAAPVRGSAQWRKIEIPSANGHATALAVARLFEAFATGGMIGGSRILSQEAFDALTTRRFLRRRSGAAVQGGLAHGRHGQCSAVFMGRTRRRSAIPARAAPAALATLSRASPSAM